MKVHKLDRQTLRVSLEYRGDDLPKQTAFLAEIREVVALRPRYPGGGRLLWNMDMVIRESLALMAEKRQGEEALSAVEVHQARIIAMIGPGFGFLPRSACCQPGSFYIDDRCRVAIIKQGGRTAYPRRLIYREVAALATLAKSLGIDPENVPGYPNFHNCGAW